MPSVSAVSSPPTWRAPLLTAYAARIFLAITVASAFAPPKGPIRHLRRHCRTTERSARKPACGKLWDRRLRGRFQTPTCPATFHGGLLSGRDAAECCRVRMGGILRLEATSASNGAAEAAIDDGVTNNGGGGGGGGLKRGFILRLISRVLLFALTFLVGFRLGLGDRETMIYGMADATVHRIPQRFPVLSLILAGLAARESWRSIPAWAKRRIVRRFSRTRSRGDVAEEPQEDPDDMTSVTNVSRKLQGLFANASTKLSSPMESYEFQASLLSLVQLTWQVKAQRAEARDKVYESSGIPGTLEDLEGLPEGFEFADWAYDEDPNGTLKENLERSNFSLVRHDKTAIPGYVGHYVAICPERKLALIGVKGTSTFEDLLTDCCGQAVTHTLEGPFIPGGENEIRCHEGVLISAKRLADEIQPLVKELFLPAGYKLLITGHSLGAGASALLAIILRSRNPSLVSDLGDKLKVLAYASPPVLDIDSAVQCTPFTTTVVNNCDVIPRASMSNLIILHELLKTVDKKLEERGIGSGKSVDTIALIKKLSKGTRGEMLMEPAEITRELERAQEKVGLRDPDHLFVPGRVITMYERWGEQSVQPEGDEAVTAPTKEPEQYVRVSDGAMNVLRYIEIDKNMMADHMAPAYRKSLKDLTLELAIS